MQGSTRVGTGGLALVALLLLIALVIGIAGGLNQDPVGQWALAGIAAIGLSMGLLLLWESGPSRGTLFARLIWVGIWILPIISLMLCRLIALSSP